MILIFEGPDGSGKSSQLQLTQAWLESQGYKVTATREPGGHPVYGPQIREMLLGDGNKARGLTELYGFMFDRALHWQDVVIPALERGDMVLCDRMFESSLVYQGIVKGHGYHTVLQLNHLFEAAYPHHFKRFCTLVFDGSDAVLDARLDARVAAGESDDKHDKMGNEFRLRVRSAYREVLAQAPKYWRLDVDSSGTLQEVQVEVRKNVATLLHRWYNAEIKVNLP